MKRLLFCLSSFVFVLTYVNAQIPSCPGDNFGGNIRVNITSLNPQIEIPNISGEAPFAVHVSAMNSTATGTSRPYEDVEYSWNFGDNSTTGGFIINHPVDGTNMAVNTAQKGPEGAYLYETPGVYTITLTARAWDGNTFISNVVTAIVTVSAWPGQTRYFDPTNGDDNNTGMSPAAPWQSWAQLETWIEGGDNRSALLKRGEMFQISATLNINRNGIRIGAYDIGNRPILTISSANLSFLDINASNTSIVSDHVYSDLIIDANNMLTARAFRGFADATSSLKRFTFINCDFKNAIDRSLWVTTGTGNNEHFLMWVCNFDANIGGNQSFGAGRINYVAYIGGNLIGGDGSIGLDHHMYISYCNHALIRWVDFGAVIARAFCLNMNASGDTVNEDSEFTLIDGCNVTGTRNGIDFSNTHNDPDFSQHDYAIVQNCAIHDLNLVSQGIGVFGYNIKNITIRDNFFYNNNASHLSLDDTTLVYNVYQNKFHASQSSNQHTVNLENGQSGNFIDNIFVNGAADGSNRYQFTGGFDNIADFVIDYNQYYNPNSDTRTYRLGSGNYVNFAAWQNLGYDVNGFMANPLFPDPGNGDFGAPPISGFSFTTNAATINFTNATISDLLATYSWDFGDGSPLNMENNPMHTYAATGFFTVNLISTNYCGIDNSSEQVLIDNLLAVEYLEPLKATLTHKNVKLTWSTTSATNNNYFIIERSNDALHWQKMALVDAKNSSSAIAFYTTNDSSPLSGTSYYRLKQFNYDDTFTYSNTVSVNYMEINFSIYPNPTKGQIALLLPNKINVMLTLSNLTGNVLLKKIKKGKRLNLDLRHLPNGIYLVDLYTNEQQTAQKLIGSKLIFLSK